MHTIETRRLRGAGGVVRVGGALALLLAAVASQAATFVVNHPTDSGTTSCNGGSDLCTLRDAIDKANHSAGADTITFAASVVGINLNPTRGAIPITDALTITGPGAAQLAIDAQNAHRVFDIGVPTPGDPVFNVTISALTLINGEAPAGEDGGAIAIGDANLTLTDCAIALSHADGSGGALFAAPSVSTSLSVQRCTLSDNHAGADGGAIGGHVDTLSLGDLVVEENSAGGSGGGAYLTVLNATVLRSRFSLNAANGASGKGGGLALDGAKNVITNATLGDLRLEDNSSSGAGGGLALYRFTTAGAERLELARNSASGLGGGVHADSATTLTLRNSTLAGNTAGAGGGIATATAGSTALTSVTVFGNTATGGAGGGVNIGAGTTFSANSTIVANNNGAPGPDAGGTLTLNYSLLKNASGASSGGSNNLPANTDPQLEALADYGGATLTLRPKAGSPVLNVGDTAIINGTDQRGLARVVGGRVDMGAVERQTAEDVIFKHGFE